MASEIDTNFFRFVQQLRDHAGVLYRSVQAATQRKWFQPIPAINDPSQLPAEVYNRDALNNQYISATNSQNKGALGDVISIKLQLDYLTIGERAARMRHCGLARAILLSHGRRYGHANGSLFTDAPGGIVSASANFTRAGSN